MSEQGVPVLDELDRRGRTAATALRHRIDALLAEEAPAAAAPILAGRPDGVGPTGPAGTVESRGGPADPPSPTGSGPSPATATPEGSVTTVIHLGRPAGRRRARPVRGWFLAAAVVTALAAVGGAVAGVAGDDGRPDVRSGGRADHVLPGWLPPGFAPVSVTDVPDSGSALGFGADIAAYGDPDADDPWSTPVAVFHFVADEELLGRTPEGEPVTVDGHDAWLREAEPDGIWVVGDRPGWQVEWQVDDGRMIVVGALDRDEVLAAAAAATPEPAIGTSGLPDGYTELARGPFGGADFLMTTSLFEGNLDGVGDAADGSGLVVAYADPSDRDAVRPAVVIGRRPGPASAVDLQRLWMPDTEATSVRGRHAVISRGDEPPGSAGEAGLVAVRWAETDGQIVTVVGHGVDEEAVLQVAEGLRPASPGEVAGLRDAVVEAPREFAEVPDGYVVAASGESGTGRWRVVAGSPGSLDALTLERMQGAIGSTSSDSGDLDKSPAAPLDHLWADFSDETVVVWGALWVDAATVTVEGPGGEPVALDIQEVEGWDHPVVAGSFPIDRFGLPPSDEVVVVARDAGGREVARNSTVLAS